MDAEKELVARIKKGDNLAFEELVTKYEKQIYALGLRYTGNQQDAMDVTQEVFLRVFRFINKFNEDSGFYTWIYRIAANVCKDTVSKRKKVIEISLEQESREGEYELDIPDISYNPEVVFEKREMTELILSGVSSLPEKYREVLVMREINSLSYEDISKTLGIEQGTVKSRIARAREKLRIFITSHGNLLQKSQSNNLEE